MSLGPTLNLTAGKLWISRAHFHNQQRKFKSQDSTKQKIALLLLILLGNFRFGGNICKNKLNQKKRASFQELGQGENFRTAVEAQTFSRFKRL